MKQQSKITTTIKIKEKLQRDFFGNLILPPLCPAIGSEVTSKSKEAKDNKKPKETSQLADLAVKDLCDSMDGALAGVLFGHSSKGVILEVVRHPLITLLFIIYIILFDI